MKLSYLCIIAFLSANEIVAAQAKNYQFDASQLGSLENSVDVSIFNNGGQMPGSYSVDIYINNNLSMQKEIYFYNIYDDSGKPVLKPCLSRELIIQLDILIDNYPKAKEYTLENGNRLCTFLEKIPHAKVDFSLARQELYISVPQIAIKRKTHGVAPMDKWDDGISAFRLNYDISGSRTTFRFGQDNSRDEIWSNLQPGLNYRGWRIRSMTNVIKRSSENTDWQRGITYATTSFESLKSSLTIGETFTNSDIFQPYLIHGFTLSTDEGMYPSSMRIFSPVVKGIARTQAKVTVTSNGIILFSDFVPPGPFILDELTNFSQKGELMVTIYESDGQKQSFTVPWQAPAIAVPENYLKYSIAAGEYNSEGTMSKKESIFQSTAIYGLNDRITFYGGYQGTADFYALLSGAGASLGSLGSISIDHSLSRNRRSGHPVGGIWRLRYTNQNESSGTGFQLENIRYRSPNTETLSSAIFSSDQIKNNKNGPRARYNISLNQSANQYGSFYINASYQENFDESKNQNLGGGYSWSLPSEGSLMLDWHEQNSTTRQSAKMKERIISLMLNLPLEKITGFPVNSSYRRSAFSNGITQDYAFSGSSSDQTFFWNAGHNTEKSSTSGILETSSAQFMLKTRSSQLGAWYSNNNAWKTAGTTISGGLIIHSDGITTGPSLGETISLLETGGAKNVGIYTSPNISTDSRGYAFIPSLAPYKTTNISLDPSTLSDNVEIEKTDITVTPTRGAIISAKFSARIGNQVFFTLRQKNGDTVPFGSIASLTQGESSGIVDELSRLFMAGLPDSGVINIKWGNEHCFVNYKLRAEYKESGPRTMSAVCI